MVSLAIAAVACFAMVGACSAAGGSANASRNADERADRAGLVMTRYREGSSADMAWHVVGGDPGKGMGIEALVAEGDRFEGRIVLRITERLEQTFDTQTVVRCYEYRLQDSIDDHRPDHIDCPDLPALSLSPPLPDPTLPAGIDEALLGALQGLDPAHVTEQAVLEVARSVGGSAPVLEVATVDGVIGVAIGNGLDECLSASVDASGAEVWRVPRVVAQPGELGCSASAAARGLGTTSPH